MSEIPKPVAVPNRKAKTLSGISLSETITDLPPYLLYVSDARFEPIYVSENVKLLLGLSGEEFVCNKEIWKQIIPVEDCRKVGEKFRQIKESQALHEVDFTHRILRGDGVPSWVWHRIRVEFSNSLRRFRGYIVPITGDEFCRLLEPSTISNFIHRLGNHFQLLNLAVDSLRTIAGSKETHDLQEILDKSVSLVRAFSEFSQVPAWVYAFDLMEVIEGATASQFPALMEKRIDLEQSFDPITNGLLIRGDPYLLELALTAILQNATEATSAGGKIKLRVLANSQGKVLTSLKLVIIDTGAGIDPCDLHKVTVPFFSTKVNHEGLGLSMAARFVELHGGTLKVTGGIDRGVTVEIILPLNRDVDEGCR